jgi:hypothetical protein
VFVTALNVVAGPMGTMAVVVLSLASRHSMPRMAVLPDAPTGSSDARHAMRIAWRGLGCAKELLPIARDQSAARSAGRQRAGACPEKVLLPRDIRQFRTVGERDFPRVE